MWHSFIYYYPEVLGPHSLISFEALSKVNVLGAKFNDLPYIQMHTQIGVREEESLPYLQ